ncbi:MAG: hypothetical protein Kapaf2KO_23370 [Candidatus Kapaibacteriales bacterium]
MIKLTKIEFDGDIIICHFNNGETKLLELTSIKQIKDEFISKIIEEKLITNAEIGRYGELIWPNLAFMFNRNGEKIKCDYDFSPEYVYENSIKSPSTLPQKAQ